MDRTLARAQAMKLIYEWEMGGDGGEDTRLDLLEIKPGEQEVGYMDRMVDGVLNNVDEIDRRLSAFLKGWTVERLTRVDLAILRLATYELTLGKEPESVIINEAVELGNLYSTDKAGAFINGVLGSLSRALSEERASVDGGEA